MSRLLRVFPKKKVPDKIVKAKGCYLFTRNRRYLDLTGGSTSYAILGWADAYVNNSIKKQINKFNHIDYKVWTDPNLEELSKVLCKNKKNKLDKVYFSGNSGAEACEAAMRMSYQVHFDLGKPEKRWFISRTQSYHGSTADALSLGERPNLEFYRKGLSKKRARIQMHHPKYLMQSGESLDAYAKRSASLLEKKILKIGPDKVAGFVGETIMGGLVGDVPPAPNYWKYIRNICNKYDIHLLLDEIYCGTGTSGKMYCCDYDNVTPDFLFIGKTLAAGYGALSAVITTKKISNVIKKVQGRLQHTTTYQGHSLSAAAALAVQKTVNNKNFLNHVNQLGNHMRNILFSELKDHEFFFDVRGRGLRFSFEYKCRNRDSFSEKLGQTLREKHSILISSKFHRACFTPPLILKKTEAEASLDVYIQEFKKLASNWT
tara:strand:- start:5318 stop:6610 length:1293 start_codon:yes stop_codon:yes gene_type:complete